MADEPVKFLGYKTISGATVAEFSGNDGNFVLNRANCEIRLTNLKTNFWPHDETERALNNWPKGRSGDDHEA